jgi:hypothetical protein
VRRGGDEGIFLRDETVIEAAATVIEAAVTVIEATVIAPYADSYIWASRRLRL